MARLVWVGGGLLTVSLSCSAFSLGAVQGHALIGRPLDVAIALALGDGESVADLCANATVHFADDAVPPNGVKTTVLNAGGKPTAIRVQTTGPVNETFARVDMQVGCGQRLTRSYVLLADLAPPESPSTKGLPAAVPAPSAQITEVKPETGSKPQTVVVTPAARKSVVQPTQRRTPSPAAPTRVVPKAAEIASPVGQGARLKLDPLELVAAANQMQPSLRLSVDAPVESVENADLAQRRQAARLLWQALNESPDQLAANALKAEVAGAESDRLKAELAQAQQQVQVVQAQLQEEEDNRFTQPVVLALAAALLAALAGLVVLSRRQRQPQDSQAPAWWKRPPAAPSLPTAASPKPKVASGLFEKLKQTSSLVTGRGRGAQKEPTLDIDVDTLMPEDAWPVAKPPAPPSPVKEATPSRLHSDFVHSSLMEGARSVATEELFDLQQQVEFFISLGQADQAIEVLKSHLADSDEASPLAYLDLLKLYHETGRREDYAELRQRFNQTFNGNAPDFDRYSTSRRGLERYESALSRIQSLWPEPAVLHLIERSIFRSANDDSSEVFDLEAYRELLLLYGIARDVIEGQSLEAAGDPPAAASAAPQALPASEGAGETTMQPLPMGMAPAVAAMGHMGTDAHWTADEDDGETLVPEDALAEGDALQGVGLDLDLSLHEEPHAVLPTTASAPALATVRPLGQALDLDFSELGDPETFTIKKSGSAS